MKALLRVKNLSLTIQNKKMASTIKAATAVNNISFDIYPGEILGIVGESGSGKSLTALSIMGVLSENKTPSGSIQYNGKELLSLTEKELQRIRGKEIAFVFQEASSSLNPLLKIGAQIAETLKLHGETNKALIKRSVTELMEKLMLPVNLVDAYPHQLSGGMCQRVMIALSLICRPKLLIADEPTTALDPATQSQILSLLKTINRDFGTSIIFISHDLSVVKNFCNRILVMYAGRILESGSTDDIFSNPAHEYTRGLLDSIPSGTYKEKALSGIPGKVPSLEEGLPSGCPFHPRCKKASDECKQEFPPARSIKPFDAENNADALHSADHITHCIYGGLQ